MKARGSNTRLTIYFPHVEGKSGKSGNSSSDSGIHTPPHLVHRPIGYMTKPTKAMHSKSGPSQTGFNGTLSGVCGHVTCFPLQPEGGGGVVVIGVLGQCSLGQYSLQNELYSSP